MQMHSKELSAHTLPPISTLESWRWMAGTFSKGAAMAIKAPKAGALAPRPAHVPAERVVDFDFTRIPGAEQDIHAAWLKVQRDSPDLFWTPRNTGHWVVTRAELIEKVILTPDVYSSAEVVLPRGAKPMVMLPIEADPPVHQHYRNLVAPWFTPKAVAKMREGVQTLAIEMIEELQPKGGCEFVYDFAKRFPIAIFLQLVNLPTRDRDMLLDITETAVRSKSALQIMKSFARLTNYIEYWMRQRRAQAGDDLFSAIVNGQVMGRPLTHSEIQGFMVVILLGGLDTVAAMLSFMTKFLAENPGHRQQLIERPELIPNAIDEMMRRFGIVNLSRLIAQETVLDGVTLKKGDMIHVPNKLAGIDDRRYSDPLAVDFTATGTKRHASFGLGNHRCVGSVLARMEMAIFLEEWLKRIPDFGITPGDKPRTAAGSVSGVEHLPLTWKLQ